jgi:hypothetical protein
MEGICISDHVTSNGGYRPCCHQIRLLAGQLPPARGQCSSNSFFFLVIYDLVEKKGPLYTNTSFSKLGRVIIVNWLTIGSAKEEKESRGLEIPTNALLQEGALSFLIPETESLESDD